MGSDLRTISSGWQISKTLPDLRRVGIIALDIETRDEGLRDGRGSAWPWRGGYICGISVAYRADGGIRPHYFPLRHPDTDNFDCKQVYSWLKDLFASDVRIVTQNGGYDYGWVRTEAGILMPPSDRLEELGAMATIVDENLPSYRLNALCEHYGLPGKDETLLKQAAEAMGFAPKRIKENIWQFPARYVGPYRERDAAALLPLCEKLDLTLAREGTRAAYRLEVDLLPMVLEMRLRGIPVDQDAAEQAREQILQKRDAALVELSAQLGTSVSMAEINRNKWKAQAFDKHGIKYPLTDKGNPSFSGSKQGWMVKHEHPLPRLIAEASKYEAAGNKFLKGHILDHIVNGRIFAEIHPFRSEYGGTRSLRFSYSNPPVQQMPSRDKELGPLIRDVFRPEDDQVWAKSDVSQQEFRFVVDRAEHFKLPGAREAGDAYRNDPNTDFHVLVATITALDRDTSKTINFGSIYGMGVKKLAETLGVSLQEAQAIRDQYDRALPFIARLSAICQERAERIGHTELYGGARRHWNLYEAPGVYAKGAGPCSLEEARRRKDDPTHPWYRQQLRRSHVYTALNALIQGSAAQHTKLWMRACWREGIVPLLQMHDCLDVSVSSREQGELVARLGCEAVQLTVPIQSWPCLMASANRLFPASTNAGFASKATTRAPLAR
jgi:Mesyanzhinovviridae DNA polymerase